MKKTIYTLSLFIALLCGGHLVAQSVSPQRSNVTFINMENVSVMRQTISRPITKLEAKGKSSVVLAYDTSNYVDVYFNPEQSDPIEGDIITIKGTTLTINDPIGEAVYLVHLKQRDLKFVNRSRRANIIYDDPDTTLAMMNGAAEDEEGASSNSINTGNMALQQQLDAAREQLDEARRQIQEAQRSGDKQHGQIVTETLYVEDDSPDDIEETLEIETVTDDEEASKNHTSNYGTHTVVANYYDWDERLQVSLLGAFTNWGHQWYDGLSKIGGDYNLRTSFSSFQFEVQYAIIMTRHFNFSLGVGIENDKYHFTTPLVNCSAGGILYDAMRLDYADYADFIARNETFQGTRLDDWSTHLTTRYVSIPVTIGLRTDNFHFDITALPALALNTHNTGLVHKIETRDVEARTVTDITEHFEPYKLDLRVDIRYQWFGIFAQVATMPLFNSISSSDIYPFKAGFVLAFNLY